VGRFRLAWISQPERGSLFAMRFVVWIALAVGRPAARALLYPICCYFLVFSRQARAASMQYLRKVLRREPRIADLFRHYHTFSATLLDRVFLLNDEYSRFDVHIHGEDVVADMVASGKGCFLLGAHVGSFEIIRSLGRKTPGVRLNLMMYEENAQKIKSVLDAINPNLALQVIALGRVDSMLKAETALEQGEFVSMLGDRTIKGERTIAHSFLGAPALFATGPFRIAAMLKQPIVLMVGLYRGDNRYDIHFEQLADMRQADHAQRNVVLEQALHRYVERLEHYCRLAPYNWFNFYDYWK
jgi:predicted LPLAT superfamily acyltransferase